MKRPDSIDSSPESPCDSDHVASMLPSNVVSPMGCKSSVTSGMLTKAVAKVKSGQHPLNATRPKHSPLAASVNTELDRVVNKM